MGEYTLVKKASLAEVAEAIRQKGGTAGNLRFPDGFVAAIMALNIGPAAPTSETLGLNWCGGSPVSDGTNTFSDYVNVGHSSKNRKNDAIWGFKPNINASSAVFKFSWDNSIGAVGYSAAKNYAFCITTNAAEGNVAFGASNKKVVPIGGNGASGEEEVVFTGLSLQAGTSYYIRVNHNSDPNNPEFSTLKAFAKGGNTVQLTT